MGLADFIEVHLGRIVLHWEEFAATVPAAGHMKPSELRDHVEEILRACVADLRTPQTPDQQSAKSMSLAPTPPGTQQTAAQTHAILRAKCRFDIEQELLSKVVDWWTLARATLARCSTA